MARTLFFATRVIAPLFVALGWIGPAVRYGIAPAGATVWTQPHALVAGAMYRVRVTQTVGLDVRIGGGERVFTF